jgi:cytochrome c oxidase subunit 4
MAHGHGGETEEHHIVGYGVYVVVWVTLLVLTALTVAVAGLELGKISVLTALAIATCKSWVVANHFMHLKYEDRVFKIMVVVALGTLAVIIGLTFFDVSFR